MDRRVFVVTGLGYGDEGKGTITHWLCFCYKAHTVIRTGGPQAFHRVVSVDGREHMHSQFGSGTLRGSATHLSKNIVIEPHAILAEGNALMYEQGIRGIFSMLTIHEDALVITPFQAIANRLRELSRLHQRHGSVGIGVGETVLDAEVLGDMAIRAKDLSKPNLREKLEAVRARKMHDLEEIIGCAENLPKETRDKARTEITNLKKPDTIQWAVEQFSELASRVKIVDTNYVAEKILGCDGAVVFEGSQGVLLDRWHGFHPYTTKVRTIPETALSIIRECNYYGEVKSLGVLRAYHTRHGAGPFVTECARMTKQLPDAVNGNHPWQGNFRAGAFDMVAAKYAIDASGGGKAIDSLVVTCIDRIHSIGLWKICRSYELACKYFDSEFFLKNGKGYIGNLVVRHGVDDKQLTRQERLGQLLRQCSPKVTKFEIPSHRDQEKVINFCSGILSSELKIPVFAVSAGPTEIDKIEL